MRSSTMMALAVTATLAACGGGGAAPVTGGGPDDTGGTLASFAITHPEGAVTVGDTMIMQVVARDATGQPVTGGQPQFTSSDATVATVDNAGVVRGLKAGASTITGTLTLGGVTRSATYAVAVLAAAGPPPATPPPATPPPTTPPPPAAPSTATVQGVEDAFSPSAVTIAAGGTVTWTMVDEEHDVTWTGAAPPGGSIPRIDDDEAVSRTFPSAGTYTYVCDRHDGDHGGTVTVQSGATQNPVFTSVRITPASPGVAVGATLQLTATGLDQAGQAMSGLPAAAWTTSDAARATVSATGVVAGVAAGTATVTASITSGGVTRQASVTVTVGTTTTPPPPTAPSTATVTTPGETFSPASVTIAAGGTVTWTFTGGSRHNVTFSGTAPAGGSIPDTDAGGSASRTFTAAGTYNYSCTRHSGMNGTVVVQP
ncbi:MAG TPA: plastocyanin/azurin family copper-binding protein [Longimicrobium sp.]